MTQRTRENPSPFKTGLIHFGLSLTAFSAAGVLGAGTVHLIGDQRDASPSVQVALFQSETPVEGDFVLKSRFAERESGMVLASATIDYASFEDSGDGFADGASYDATDLGLADGTSKVINVADTLARGGGQVEQGSVGDGGIVKINGRPVGPGQSFSMLDAPQPQGRERVSLEKAPIRKVRELSNGQILPVIAEDGTTPARAYARPSFADPRAPRVALVIGGLGVNEATTLQAIRDLPPEVTLSFAARESNRRRSPQHYINLARASGHETLLEIPMEPYEYGRAQPEPNTLSADLTRQDNINALYATLSTASGYFGVVNYLGDKFVTDEASVQPIVQELRSRGIALIEDGSLTRSALQGSAQSAGLTFSKADLVIDSEIQAAMISEKLAELESIALQKGYAIGTGFAFPVTVDTIVAWEAQLAEKGIELVPVSDIMFRVAPPENMAKNAGVAALPADGGKAG